VSLLCPLQAFIVLASLQAFGFSGGHFLSSLPFFRLFRELLAAAGFANSVRTFRTAFLHWLYLLFICRQQTPDKSESLAAFNASFQRLAARLFTR
jgi:hypothetical protein